MLFTIKRSIALYIIRSMKSVLIYIYVYLILSVYPFIFAFLTSVCLHCIYLSACLSVCLPNCLCLLSVLYLVCGPFNHCFFRCFIKFMYNIYFRNQCLMAITMHLDCFWPHFVRHFLVHSSTTGWVNVQILLMLFFYQADCLQMFHY